MNIEIKNEHRDYPNEKRSFIKSVRELSLTKNKLWIKSMVKKDKINPGVVLITSEQKRAYLKSIFALIDTLNATHGTDWDMHIQIKDYGMPNLEGYPTRFELMPIIRFKKFTIRNSNEEERIIQDLLVVIPLRTDGVMQTFEDQMYMSLYPDRPRGTKITWMPDAYNAQYEHSHLPRKRPHRASVFETSRFCVGNGEIQDITQQLQNDFDPNLYTMYLLMVDTLVKWESLEGRPHTYMRNITARQHTHIAYNNELMVQNFQALKYDFFGKGFTPTLLLHNNRFTIKEDEYLEKYIKTLAIEKNQFKILVKKVGGVYASYAEAAGLTTTTEEILGDENPHTIISGEKLYFKLITNIDGTEEDPKTFRIHPKFIEYVTRKFEIALIKASIRDKYVTPEDRIVNTRQR